MNHDANTEGGAAGEKGKTYTENVFSLSQQSWVAPRSGEPLLRF